jgi:hypothetical protein
MLHSIERQLGVSDVPQQDCQRSQERQQLERMKREKEERKYTSPNAGPVVYEAADEHSGYLDEAGRLGFSNTEMARQLRPILDRMKKGEGA